MSLPSSPDVGNAHSLAPLFAPRSVAVVGASDDATKVGGRVLTYLKDARFTGEVVAVNPKRSTVMGVRSVPSVAALDGRVDTAIIALPPDGCVEAVAQCARLGVGAAVVLTSGFAEAGPAGSRRQDELVAALAGSGTRLLGPNCLGVVNERIGYVGTFATMWGEPWLAPGGVSIVSQPGATASYLFVMLRERGVGISAWVATGNEADVDAAQCIAHLVHDAATRLIVVALEGVRDGPALYDAILSARHAGKAVLVLKVGRSAAAVEAVRSHTAALAGDDRVFDAVIRQAGAIRCASYSDAVDIATAHAVTGLPHGTRVGIVSASGGAGILMADRAEECGLRVPELSASLRDTLDALVPGGSSRNPVDVTAMVLNDLGLLAAPIARLRASGEVDAVVAFLTSAFRSDTSVARVIAALREDAPSRPPLLLSAFTSTENLRRLFDAGLPTFVDPARAMDVLAALHRLAQPPPPWIGGRDEAPLAPPRDLDEASLLAFFALHGVAAAPAERVATLDDALAAAQRLGYPVVLKISLPGLAHKADIGGVRANLHDDAAVRTAYAALAAAAARHAPQGEHALVVQPMVRGQREMMLGYRHDPTFGPVVALGFGGTWIEAIDDVVLRLAPFDDTQAHAMIDALRGRRLLDAARGQPACDVAALARSLASFSVVAARLRGVASAELNPVIVREAGGGAVAVDAKLVAA